MENKIMTEFEQTAIMVQLDELEKKVQEANAIIKQYDEIKSKIKSEMLKLGKENGLEELKWITPNGTQITCSVGHRAEWEDEYINEFSVDILKEKYPEIYADCFKEVKHQKQIRSASNDILRITLPKNNLEVKDDLDNSNDINNSNSNVS